MALVVEDGTGRADAESYVSVSDANLYAVAHGLTFAIAGADLALAEQALRRATQWIDATYRGRFTGIRKNRRSQALEWPRTGAYDALCPINVIGSSEIPTELVQATIEAAVREKATPGYLNPDITPGKIKRSVKVGEVAVEFAIGAGSAQEQKPVVGVITDILASLLGKAPSRYSGATAKTS